MTVSSITGGVPELKRALDQQNKANAAKPGEVKAASVFPTDTIAPSAVDLGEVITQVQAQNREAARSTLNDADLDALQPAQTPQEQVQQQAIAATRAQTNKLPPTILQLIAE